MAKAQVLTDFNAFLDGHGFIGIANKITMPEVVAKTIEKNLSGHAGSFEIATGRFEALSSEIELNAYAAEFLALIGDESMASIPFIARGSLRSNGDDLPIKVVMQGLWKSVSLGAFEVDSEIATNYKLSIRKFTVEIDSKEVIYINLETNGVRMGKKDLTAKIRANLGM